MSQWLDRVDGLLYDGETVESRVDVGTGGVVVTSHRVLAFTPDGDGANFSGVERPNVEGVERATKGNVLFVVQAVKAIVVGGVLLAAGQLVSLDGLVGSIDLTTTAGMGLGGFLRTMGTLLDVLAMLDDLMTLAGALALLAGVALLGLYARTRRDLLVVGVAGEDDLELPLDGDEDDGAGANGETDDDSLADELDRAVRPNATQEGTVRGESARDPLA